MKSHLSIMFTCLQAKTGHQKEFEVALQRLRGKDVDISEEAAEIQVLALYSNLHSL